MSRMVGMLDGEMVGMAGSLYRSWWVRVIYVVSTFRGALVSPLISDTGACNILMINCVVRAHIRGISMQRCCA